jgi:pimeloyl-ACP methyl ester carboxylesterase
VHAGVAVWSGGDPSSEIDIWFLPALGDSHLCFRDVFKQPIAQHVRAFLFDLPGHGASPARAAGLTVEEAATIWADLVRHFSPSRRVVLVGHSMAGIVATRTAQLLDCSPSLVISIEGNLTLADAYFSGQAARFDQPEAFHAWFQSEILEWAKHDEVLRRFSCSLQFADPNTLWTLGRSALNCPNPGDDFLGLTCPSVYYWDPGSTTDESKAFLAQHSVRKRKLEGLGHWPMITSPAQFYAAVEQDVLRP